MDDRPDDRDLAIIRRLMEDTEHGVPEGGKHLIIWGSVVALALVLTYASVRGAPLPIGWLWGAGLLAGWATSFWVGWRDEARAPIRTVLERVVAGIWIGCGVSASLTAVLGYYARAIPASALPGAVALVVAAACFASSFAYRSAWMRLVAAGWWLGATGMLLAPGPGSLLLMAALLVAFQIVPGVLLYRRAREQRPTRAA